MFSLADFAEVKRLLDQVALVEDRLTPNELELFRTLKARYDDPGAGSFDDKTCLEVTLRNIEIRQKVGLAPGDTTKRVIDLPRVDGDGAGPSESES